MSHRVNGKFEIFAQNKHFIILLEAGLIILYMSIHRDLKIVLLMNLYQEKSEI